MSSNKIGFLCAFGIYATIILCFVLLNFKINLVGKSGESSAFSIRLENIAGDLGVQMPKPRKVKQTPKPKNIAMKPTRKSSTNSQNLDESSTQSSDSRGGAVSRAQESSGESDPYFLAITRIINKYHAKEPIKNLYGIVGVAFSINTNGEMEHLRIISSSGSERLDSVALRTIRRAARNFPPPRHTYHIQTRLVYKRG